MIQATQDGTGHLFHAWVNFQCHIGLWDVEDMTPSLGLGSRATQKQPWALSCQHCTH